MWLSVFVFLILRYSSALGENNISEARYNYNTELNLKNQVKASRNSAVISEGKMEKYFHSFLDMIAWVTNSLKEEGELREKVFTPIPGNFEEGRRLKLKYRKSEVLFIMKTFMVLKVILGLLLPLGIIASKILSWKAVTLSLMAFMLAKILFVKNLLSGQNKYSTPTANFVPPVFIHTSPNEAFWRRQGDSQPLYSLNR